MIKNGSFVKSCLKNTEFGKESPNGFDLSLKEIKQVNGKGEIDIFYTILPNYSLIYPVNGEYDLTSGIYSITFNEGGEIPQNYCGIIKPRSSLVRSGACIFSGLYDTGFNCDNFGAMLYVLNPYGIKIKQGVLLAQLILMEAEQTFKYDGQWQGKKDIK